MPVKLLPLLLAFAAVATAAEFEISQPAIGVAPGWKMSPRIAASANGFLVVWVDELGGVRATRLASDGAVEDARDFLIAAGGKWVDVASDGREYLVAWSDGGPEGRTRFVRVTANGFVAPGLQSIAGVIDELEWIGGTYAVSTWGTRGISLVDRAGVVLRERIAVPRVDSRSNIAITPGGVVAWWNSRDIVAARLTRDGELEPRVIATPSATAAAGYLDAADDESGGAMVVWMAAGETYGVTLDAALRPIAGPQSTGTGFQTRVIRTGTRYLLLDRASTKGQDFDVVGNLPGAMIVTSDLEPWFNAASYLRLTRLDASGNPMRLPSIDAIASIARREALQQEPAIARCGDRWVVAWTERSDRYVVRMRSFDDEGNPLGRAMGIDQEPGVGQRWPAIACGAGTMLVTWAELDTIQAGRARLIGLFTSGSQPRRVNLGPTSLTGARVFFDGGAYIVVRLFNQRLYVRRWSMNGEPLGEERMLLFDAGLQHEFSAAFDGGEVVIAWTRWSSDLRTGSVRVLRLDASLAPAGEPVNLFIEQDVFPTRTAVEATPTGWLVWWKQGACCGADVAQEGWSAELSRELLVVRPPERTEFPVGVRLGGLHVFARAGRLYGALE